MLLPLDYVFADLYGEVLGDPHHIRSCIPQNCDFRESSENLKTINHFLET